MYIEELYAAMTQEEYEDIKDCEREDDYEVHQIDWDYIWGEDDR